MADGDGGLAFDDDAPVDLPSLLRAATLVVAHGSTTLVESLLLGTAAAFAQRLCDA